jgi:hypothetical protein
MLNVKQRIILSVLVIISIVLCLFAAGLQSGYEHPIQNADSHGNQLGFNNPLTWELYGVLLKSASLISVIQMLGWYGVIYLFFHFAALWLFVINPSIKARRMIASCFFIQVLVFPMSLLGFWFTPFLVSSFLTGKIDGETLTDIPFPFWVLFQTVWFIVSSTTGVLIWRRTELFASSYAVRAEGTTGN